MSESSDYDPGPWTGYDFRSARASYDAYAGRSYDVAVSKKVAKTDLIPEKIETKSSAPLVIACDVTGSMGEWPATIFSKLPYLDLEGQEYLGEDMEISFAAVGDVFSDKYPLQVRPFGRGKDLEARLKELIVEGNGGGQTCESYDIAAYYYAHNVEMPNAIKPIFIFIGDEGLYDFLDKNSAETLCFGTDVKRITVEQVIRELQNKFAVYLVRKPYGSTSESNAHESVNFKIQSQWEKLLGEDHVCILPDASRVVDVIFGILARETGRVDYFKDEIKGRQKPEQVDVVMKSLVTIHKIDKKSVKKIEGPKTSKSITRRSKSSVNEDDLPASRSLLD